MATNATLITLTQAAIDALDGSQNVDELAELKIRAVKLNMDTAAIDSRLVALDMAGATSEEIATNTIANTLASNFPTGLLIEHVGNKVGNAPLLIADGSAINPSAHPKLAAITPLSYKPLDVNNSTNTVLGANHYGVSGFSADGTVILSVLRNNSNAHLTIYLSINGVTTQTTVGFYTDLDGQPTVSDDGSRAMMVYLNADVSDIGICYINTSGVLTTKNLQSGRVASGTIAGAISRDGSAAYAICKADTATRLKVFKSTNGWTSFTQAEHANITGVSDVRALCTSYNGVYVYGFDYQSMYKSADSGATFTKLSLPFTVSSGSSCVCSDSGQYIYISSSYRLWWSSDYGASFEQIYLDRIVPGNVGVGFRGFSLRHSDSRLFVICQSTNVTTALVDLSMTYSDNNGDTFTSGPQRLSGAETYGMQTIPAYSPFWVADDDSRMLSTHSSISATLYETPLAFDKFLPDIPSKKVVGG